MSVDETNSTFNHNNRKSVTKAILHLHLASPFDFISSIFAYRRINKLMQNCKTLRATGKKKIVPTLFKSFFMVLRKRVKVFLKSINMKR